MANNYNGCNNNCEAVAGLQEKAANLVAYSNLINSWLNGPSNATVNIAGVNTPTLLKLVTDLRTLINQIPQSILQQNGGIAINENGKLYIDFSTMPDTLLYSLLQKIILENGGLKFNSQGKLFVDFDGMPTDKFDEIIETFRKGLRLPKWLTANLSVFVDYSSAAASDVVDEGRGLSASKPFKTLQAAVSYITDNYNLSIYNVSIYVKENTVYEGPRLVLPSYQTNTGVILIYSWTGSGTTKSNNRFKVKRTAAAEGTAGLTGAVCCRGGTWYLYNVDAESEISAFTPTYTEISGINCFNGGNLYLEGFAARCKLTDADSINASGASMIRVNLINCLRNSMLTISPGSIASELEITKNSNITKTVRNQALSCSGNMNIYGSNVSGKNGDLFVKSSQMNTFAEVSLGGQIQVSSSGIQIPYMDIKMASGYTASGKRYSCTSGGSIVSGGRGPDYFPGAIAGTVDAESYSWYK